MDETYRVAVERLRLEGRLADYRAGELKASYVLRRRLFGFGALLTCVVWLVLICIARSWIAIALETIPLVVVFLFLIRQSTLLGYKIGEVSERVSDHMNEFLDEYIAPLPELHRLFQAWRAQGPLWRHDESRLIEIAQYAKLMESERHDPMA